MKNSPIHIGGRKSVYPDDIMLLEAKANYTLLYLFDGKTIFVATTLKILEKRFSENQNFFRTHRSHVINIEYITEYKSVTNIILMHNDKTILISRRRKKAFHLKLPRNNCCFEKV